MLVKYFSVFSVPFRNVLQASLSFWGRKMHSWERHLGFTKAVTTQKDLVPQFLGSLPHFLVYRLAI